MEITGVYHSKSGHTIGFKTENESDPYMYNNEPYICITLDKVSTTINSLVLKGNFSASGMQPKSFHATTDEYTDFLNNVLDKEINWKVKNRIGGEVTIPGIWSKKPIATNPHTNANTIPTRTPKANKLKKRQKTYKTSLSTILEEEEGSKGGKRRKTKKRKQRKSNKRRK